MILDILQIIIAVILITAVLLQNRGAGVGATFGGEGNIYRTKRGIEKNLHIITIILVIIFLALSVANSLFDF